MQFLFYGRAVLLSDVRPRGVAFYTSQVSQTFAGPARRVGCRSYGRNDLRFTELQFQVCMACFDHKVSCTITIATKSHFFSQAFVGSGGGRGWCLLPGTRFCCCCAIPSGGPTLCWAVVRFIWCRRTIPLACTAFNSLVCFFLTLSTAAAGVSTRHLLLLFVPAWRFSIGGRAGDLRELRRAFLFAPVLATSLVRPIAFLATTPSNVYHWCTLRH